jgi:hypothetical protein
MFGQSRAITGYFFCGEAGNTKEKGVVESGERTMGRTDAPAWS